jgi:hypothetical protein
VRCDEANKVLTARKQVAVIDGSGTTPLQRNFFDLFMLSSKNRN